MGRGGCSYHWRGLTQGDQHWIETHITHTHHHTTQEISGGASPLKHPAVCVHLTHPCCCYCYCSSICLLGRKQQRPSLSLWVHAKHSWACVCVCDGFWSLNTLDSTASFLILFSKTFLINKEVNREYCKPPVERSRKKKHTKKFHLVGVCV